jgi:hypothetical protein
MAQYEHLPLYRDTFKFLIYCETIVQHFARYHKYTHGSDLRNTARTVVKLIIRANNATEKEPVLEELRVAIEEIKVIIRICKEVKAFNNFHSFETAINQVTDISRQAEGWLKGVRKKRQGQNP